MLPNLDPKKMQAMMRQLGIAQEELDAKRVIIETDDKKIIIDNPSVIKIKMQGQENFQVSGDISEQPIEESEDKAEEDVQTIMEKTKCTEEDARKALEESSGDLAEAILSLS
ncbi:nascent polypeptide-associated complex protein [Candidatus Pacearchaeota archaeon]|nr:nascent polypeptide-associated complex protein [Candidatus Pacearchaeota archaeon]